MRFMNLTITTVSAKDLAEGQIRYAAHVAEGFHTHASLEKLRVSTCKNCGAPVHNNTCEYCGTEY